MSKNYPSTENLCVRVSAIANVHPLTVRRYLQGSSRPTPIVHAAIKSALAQLGVNDPRTELDSISSLPELRA